MEKYCEGTCKKENNHHPYALDKKYVSGRYANEKPGLPLFIFGLQSGKKFDHNCLDYARWNV